MTTHIPAITIGLPVYNGERFLRQALDAWLNQSFNDFLLIITDNASTDDTEAICREYARRDPRIQYVRSATNEGAAANFNKAFRLNRSPYFKWAAHDDVYAPDFLHRCLSVLEADPTVVLAYSRARSIDEEGTVRPGGFVAAPEQASRDPIVRYRSILHETVWCYEVFGVIRSSALERSSLIGNYFGSDRVLLTELSLLGSFHQVDEDLFFRRFHPNQSTSVRMTPRKQAQWISGRSQRGFVLPQWHTFTGYLAALRKADLSVWDQLRGAASVLRLATRPDKLKRFVVPGPYNYLGIRARASTPRRTGTRNAGISPPPAYARSSAHAMNVGILAWVRSAKNTFWKRSGN